MAPKIDISKLSLQQRRDLLAQLKGRTSPISDPEYRPSAERSNASLTNCATSQGVSLTDVFTLPEEDKTYTNSKGETWHNWQKGRKPDWVMAQESN